MEDAPKHDALVACPDVLHVPRARVHRLGNVRRLLFDRHDHVHGVVVEALARIVVADLLDRVADDLEGRKGRNRRKKGVKE